MSTFILVHGAYHGAWCWSRVTPLLDAAGYTVVTPDLPGHGDDPTPLKDVSMASYTAAVCQAVAGAEAPVVLVGHSMAGAIVTGVAELMPERIDRLVYLSAYVPADGQSVADLVRADTQFTIPVTRFDAAGVPCLRLSPDVTRRHFYHDVDAADLAGAQARVQDQAVAPFAAKVTLTAANFGRVARAYIHCRNDRAIGFALQRQMAVAAGCAPTLALKCGHSPFLTQPAALAQHLLGLAV